jgi:hypothetical protein
MASEILTPEQRHTLRLAYTFLHGATVYLEAIQPIVIPEDQPQVSNLLDLGVLCISKLVENFPEIAVWEERAGGAR